MLLVTVTMQFVLRSANRDRKRILAAAEKRNRKSIIHIPDSTYFLRNKRTGFSVTLVSYLKSLF